MAGNDRKRRQGTEIMNNENKERRRTNNEIQKQRLKEKRRERKEKIISKEREQRMGGRTGKNICIGIWYISCI
jgi:hypothetical protein